MPMPIVPPPAHVARCRRVHPAALVYGLAIRAIQWEQASDKRFPAPTRPARVLPTAYRPARSGIQGGTYDLRSTASQRC
jgi:hypothetical protein